MSSNIAVKITADVVDLKAKFAVARAESNALTSDLNKLARQAAQSGTTAQLKAQLTQAAGAAATAQGKVSSLGAQLRKLGADAGSSHGALSTATREFRALFDELTSGRTRMTPGTLAIIATRVFGLGGAALAAIAGVGALVGGLAALAYNAIQAADAVAKIDLVGKFAGGIGLTKAQIQDLINTLAELPGVSRTDAQAAVDAFVEMGVKGSAALGGLSQAATRYAEATGTEVPAAAKKLAAILADTHTSVAQLQKDFPGLTAAQAENYVAIERLGDQHQTAAALIELVAERTKDSGQAWADYTGVLSRFGSNLALELGAMQRVRSATEVQQVLDRTNIQLWNDQTKALQGYVEALHGLPASSNDTLTKAMELAANSSHARVENLKSDIATLQKAQKDPSATTEMKANFASEIDDAQRQIKSLQNKSAFGETGFSNAGDKAITEARAAISEINADQTKGDAERTAEINRTYDALLSSGKLNAKQVLDVEKAKNDALAAEARRAATEKRQIDTSNAQTALELSRVGFQEQRAALESQVSAGLITKQSELAQLMEIARQEGDAQLAALNQAQQGYAADSAYFIEQENRKKVVAAQTEAEIASLRLQSTRETARQEAEIWRQSYNQIEQAESGFIRNLFSGRMSVLQALGSAFGQFVEKEIEEDARGLTARLLLSQQELAQDQSLGRLGVLAHMLFEGQKTGATAAGEAARTSTKEAARSAGSAADVAAGGAQIANDAFKAAAGAFSAVAGIPIVGPFLAPVAAATAFTAVMAFDTLKSFDVGTNYVPRDMVAKVHAGERIIPAADNSALMRALGAGGAGGDMHLHYSPSVNAPQGRSLSQHLANEAVAMRDWFHEQMRDGYIRVG